MSDRFTIFLKNSSTTAVSVSAPRTRIGGQDTSEDRDSQTFYFSEHTILR